MFACRFSLYFSTTLSKISMIAAASRSLRELPASIPQTPVLGSIGAAEFGPHQP